MPDNIYQASAERFANDTAHHKLTVLHDDGLYRHLRFMPKTGSSAYWYDLITVPGALIFQGDGESFAFRRVTDMFGFFRSNPDRGITRINPHYWAEKLTNGRDSVKTYSRELFERHVAEALADAEEDWPGITAAWTEHAGDDNLDYNTEYEDDARRALADFEFGALTVATCKCGESIEVPATDIIPLAWRDRHPRSDSTHAYTLDRKPGFRFEDTWEWDFRDYDWWFLWACHGIVWGIAQYDAHRAEPADAPAVTEAAVTVGAVA